MKMIIHSIIITIITSIITLMVGGDNMNLIFLIFCSLPSTAIMVFIFLYSKYISSNNPILIILYGIIYYFILINLALMFGLEDSIELEDITDYFDDFLEISTLIYTQTVLLTMFSTMAKINISNGVEISEKKTNIP